MSIKIPELPELTEEVFNHLSELDKLFYTFVKKEKGDKK